MRVQPPAVTAVLSRFRAIELARLPARPVTARAYDTIYSAYMLDLAARLNAAGIPYDVAGTPGNVVQLATDTNAITGRAFSYMVEGVEAARDEAIAAVLLPWSFGAYLDALGAGQEPAVTRKAMVASPRAFDVAPEDWEADDDFRERIALAPEALSTCGPEGAYLKFALDTAGVLAAACYGPQSFGGTASNPFVPPGEVRIPILALAGNGAAAPALIARVAAEVNAEARRPIADFVTVSAAGVVEWAIGATLYCGPGIDLRAVGLAALARLRALADLQHRPGGSVLLQDVFAACKVPDANGASMVGFVDPGGFADVNPGPVSPANPHPAFRAPWCEPGEGLASAAPVSVDVDGSMLIAWGGISLRMVQSNV